MRLPWRSGSDLSSRLRPLLEAPPAADEQDDVDRCERLRTELLAFDEVIGDVFESQGGATTMTVGSETSTAASSPARALLLYRLVRRLGPARIVEFGSATGVSGSYLASALAANGSGELVTIEGSPSRQKIASRSIESVSPGRTTSIAGFFDDHLDVLDGADLFFLDGNHYADPTAVYVDEAVRRMRPDAVLVLDDVRRYSPEMDAAWERLRRDDRFAARGEAGSTGLLARDGSARGRLQA